MKPVDSSCGSLRRVFHPLYFFYSRFFFEGQLHLMIQLAAERPEISKSFPFLHETNYSKLSKRFRIIES